jgi:pimeloyl-ACP methyl ester carboxylesterase
MHQTQNSRVKPFSISVPQADLDDLRDRLARTRLTPSPRPGWVLGTDIEYMKCLLAEWRDRYDWRVVESRLNRLKQYTSEVDGYRIHFVWEKGSRADALPLVLTHGWPGSFVEFEQIIMPLAHPEQFGEDPNDSFDVIVPSIPGYGWSPAPSCPITTRDVSRIWHHLMTDVLGYKSYVAQGGDGGSLVASWLGVDQPQVVRAIHINMMGLRPYTGEGSAPLAPEEKEWLEIARRRLRQESGYQVIQGTKPQTLSFGLNDSPIGLAAWIVEKFHGWSDGSTGVPPFTSEQLITNVMVYWLTQSIYSSIWLYTAARIAGDMGLRKNEFVSAPTGFLSCPHDLFPPPPDAWVKRTYNLVQRTNWERGGHFAAYEQGDKLVREIRSFFRQFRTRSASQGQGIGSLQPKPS